MTQSVFHVLILCQGNVCRSPMAEALWKKYFPEHEVQSGGLQALVGNPAQMHAITVMDQLGLDIRAHRGRQLSESLLHTAQLVLVMTRNQQNILESRMPWSKGRVFRLGHWEGFDIDDPMGRGIDTFVRVRDLMVQCVQSWQTKF